jgi:LCP family protein required for cell wall assembly
MPTRARPTESDPTETVQIPAVTERGKEKPPRRPRRTKRVILVSAAVVLSLIGCLFVAGGLYMRSVNSHVKRVDAFQDVPAQSRPDIVAPDAKNLLVLGSDSRDPENSSGARSDTIIVAHLPKGRDSAQLVSIPRDTWVHVPATKDGKNGNTDAKINAAFAWGGIPLVVQTVEAYTGLRIDHVVIIDFSGFKQIVDALGGVDIEVEESFTSTHSLNKNGRRHFEKGLQTMDGAAALDYSRERFAFKDGDFARIRHQQQVIRAILDKAATAGILANPARLNSLLKATADAVSVDTTLSIFDMAMELRNLRSGSLMFLTNPSKGTGRVGDQSVVLPDNDKAKILYDALRRDAVGEIPQGK